MCHLLLLMPVVALPVFWLMPAGMAAPIYVAVLALSGGVYFVALKAMRQPALTGAEALIGRAGKVVAIHHGVPYIRLGNETWEAICPGASFSVGDSASVTGVDGLTLIVRKQVGDSPTSASGLPAHDCARHARADQGARDAATGN